MPKERRSANINQPRVTSTTGLVVVSGGGGGGSQPGTLTGSTTNTITSAGLHYHAVQLAHSALLGVAADDHHDPVTVGNTGLSVSGQQVSLNLAAVSGLEVSSGLRLADSIAGDGLTIASKILAVGVSGLGLSVGADAVTLTSSSNPGAAASILASDASGYLQLTRIGLGTAPSFPLHASAATAQLRLDYNADNHATFTVGATGNLTIDPSGGIINPGTADKLQSPTFASGLNGWSIDGAGTAEFNNVFVRGELHAAVFVKDLIEAHAGTLLVSKSSGALATDMTVPTTGGWVMVLKDPPGGGFLFSENDICRCKAEYSGGIVDLWFKVSSPIDLGNGTQRWTCVWESGDRSAERAIVAGSPVVDYGVSGQGFHMITADLNNAPYYQIATHAGSPWSSLALRLRMGNLNGSYGYASDTYGLAFGRYANSSSFLTADDTNGIRILKRAADANTVLAQWAMDGAITIGEVAASRNNVVISSGALSIRNNTTERIGLTAAGVLTIKDSSGAAVITLDASAGAEITKKLTMPGANSAIAIGATPPTANNSGTGIWIDRTGMYGLASNVLQTKFDATTGKLMAGGGSHILDKDGFTIREAGDTYLYRYYDINDHLVSDDYVLIDESTPPAKYIYRDIVVNDDYYTAGGFRFLVNRGGASRVKLELNTFSPSRLTLNADVFAIFGGALNVGKTGIYGSAGDIYASGGLNLGTATGAGAGAINSTGSANVLQWVLKNARATDPALVQFGVLDSADKGVFMGRRDANDATYTGYGAAGDAFVYTGSSGRGLNIVVPDATNGILRFFVGTSAASLANANMTLLKSGRVLIGTASDDGVNRLQINGSVKAVYTTTSWLDILDGVAAPATVAGWARIYVDTADGDLKIKFGDGTVKTIVTD